VRVSEGARLGCCSGRSRSALGCSILLSARNQEGGSRLGPAGAGAFICQRVRVRVRVRVLGSHWVRVRARAERLHGAPGMPGTAFLCVSVP
jgi:hypothetical protein